MHSPARVREFENDDPPALRDGTREHPIAGAWRPMLRAVVHCLVAGDYRLTKGVLGVEPVSPDTAEHMRAYVAGYGATLIDLPPETWRTSVSHWYGSDWSVMVDLWTAEEGRSDMVLSGRIVESEAGPRFSIDMVYVP